MPLNSVQQYVKGLFDGLVIPGTAPQQTLAAYITPPTVEPLDGPKAFVWGGRARGRRQTMPRGPGFKEVPWVVDVYLVYETTPDDPALDEAFPLVIDAVLAKAWTTTMPLEITDSVTNVTSQIQAIGEEWELEYPPERLPSTLRMVYYSARIGLDVLEVVQA